MYQNKFNFLIVVTILALISYLLIFSQNINYKKKSSNGISNGKKQDTQLVKENKNYNHNQTYSVHQLDTFKFETINYEYNNQGLLYLDKIDRLKETIKNRAIKNIPIDLVTLGKLKSFFIENNDLNEYQFYLESLPDSYEMKNELIADLAFLYQERGETSKAVDLLESLRYEQENTRIHYFMSDILLKTGNTPEAINELLEASKISENPYQYKKISEILSSSGDTDGATYYSEIANTLETANYH